ncbi:MAG: hypothetical protein Q9211_006747, partial [Gyalolechia sp. 1 TL-2023]
EQQSLSQASHSTLLGIQSLSSRSSAAVIASSDHFTHLQETLPLLVEKANTLQDDIPKLDETAAAFSTTYSRSTENEYLDRRKRALLLERNADRLSDILDLPTLLTSAISSSTAQGASSMTNYATALDLHSHIKRLHLLYSESPLVGSIYAQTEYAMQDLTLHLISSLRAANIKLAAGMRTIGWLRRVAPELETAGKRTLNREGLLGHLFLLCRLSTLVTTFSALEPLRQLADQETESRLQKASTSTTDRSINGGGWHGGQQTERYLKKYIEIFREQSFAIVSMYRSIFPSAADDPMAEDVKSSLRLKSTGVPPQRVVRNDESEPPPPAISTFPTHLTALLFDTLTQYLPNVLDRTSRESLLTQVLYCAGSLGRLGGDFSLMLAILGSPIAHEVDSSEDEDDKAENEWVDVMKKHRELAGKLEALASGVGVSKGADEGGDPIQDICQASSLSVAMVRNIVVLGGSSHPQLNSTICDHLQIPTGNVLLSKFSVGETRVEIQESVRGKDVYILQSGGGRVNDHLVELLIAISACKTASARKVTAVLPLFPYSRQSDIPYNKTGAPLSRASHCYNKPDYPYSFESKPQTPHPDHPHSIGLTNGVNGLHKGLEKLQVDNAVFGSQSAQNPQNGRYSNYVHGPPKRSDTLDSQVSSSSNRQRNTSASTAANGNMHNDDAASTTSSKDFHFQPQPGYKQWVAQAGTLVADLLTCAGADHVITMDLHDPQYQGFFDIPVDNLYGRPLLKKYIRNEIPDYQQAVVVSPDAGGAKRATAIADGLGMPFALIHKERRPTKITDRQNATMMLVGDVSNRTAILVDDLADTSNTITRAAKLLKKEGATKVYALLTHGVLSGDAIDRINASALDKVVVTNSTPQEEHKRRCPKLEVLEVGHIFAEVSVSEFLKELLS